MDANLLLFKHLGRGCNMGHNTGSCHLAARPRTVIAGDGWGTIAVPVIEAHWGNI